MERFDSIAGYQENCMAKMTIKSYTGISSLHRFIAILLAIVVAISTCVSELRAQDTPVNHPSQSEANPLTPVTKAELMRIDYWLNLGRDNSQENDMYMTKYAATLDSLDITVNNPASFTLVSEEDIPRPFFVSPNPNFVTKYFHCVNGWSVTGPILESAAKDALFVYPILIDCESPIRKMESELIVANQNDELDITPMITHLKGNDARKFSNADEIFFYDYDMSQPVIGKYNHVVGIVLIKKGHYSMGLKVIMDDEGMKKREEYVRLILENVRYGDTTSSECSQLNSEPVKFPLKKFKCDHDR